SAWLRRAGTRRCQPAAVGPRRRWEGRPAWATLRPPAPHAHPPAWARYAPRGLRLRRLGVCLRHTHGHCCLAAVSQQLDAGGACCLPCVSGSEAWCRGCLSAAASAGAEDFLVRAFGWAGNARGPARGPVLSLPRETVTGWLV